MDFVSMRVCLLPTLSDQTVPPSVHSHFVFAIGEGEGAIPSLSSESALRCCTPALMESGAF